METNQKKVGVAVEICVENDRALSKICQRNEPGWVEKLKIVYSWKDGWMDGWMGVKAVLRIAYSNQK